MADCEYSNRQEHHEESKYEKVVFNISINHQYIIVQVSNPEAQAYLLEQDSSSEHIAGREGELRQVTSGSGSTSIVSGLREKTGSSERAIRTNQTSQRTRRGQTRNWRGFSAGSRPGTRQAGPDNPATDACGPSMQRREHSRRRRKWKVKPIILKDPYPFEGKPGEDCDAWWVIIQTFIKDQPEKFHDTKRTINCVGGLLKKYAAPWHVQWDRQALARKCVSSRTTYLMGLLLRI